MTRWWGKAAGSTLGFAAFGPLGALIGAAVGHEFDKGLSAELDTGHSPSGGVYPFRDILLSASFALIGYVGSRDGAPGAAHARAVTGLVTEMQLTPERASDAQQHFQRGAAAGYRPEPDTERLRVACRGRPDLLRELLDMQLRVCVAGGGPGAAARAALQEIGARLGLSRIQLMQAEAVAKLRRSSAHGDAASDQRLHGAYARLGVAPGAADDVVTRAYRRLMSRHHPDKLMGDSPTEAQLLEARSNTRAVRAAYELIREARRG